MKLLLPPGLGDVHWCMLKMQSFARVWDDGEKPEIWLTSMRDGKDRAGDYVKKLPFVTFGGYHDMREHKRDLHRVFRDGEILRDYQGFDAFYAYNRAVENGTPPERWWPTTDCEADFHYPIETNLAESAARERCLAHGPYVLVSFYEHGFYKGWCNAMQPTGVIRALQKAFPDHRILITGAEWDRPFASRLAQTTGAESLAGETSIDELFGMIRGASAYVGHAAGNAMMAVHLRTPTVMLWNPNTFRPPMWRCWAPPDEDHYHAVNIASSKPFAIAEEVAARV